MNVGSGRIQRTQCPAFHDFPTSISPCRRLIGESCSESEPAEATPLRARG